jgi:hypothetical protein
MTATNRVRMTVIREITPGITPGGPRMRTMRITGEGLTFSPTFVDSEEIRSDRMDADPMMVFQAGSGSLSFEALYPLDNTPESEIIRSAMYNPWVNTPTFFNDGVADSVVTDAGTAANTYAVVSGGTAAVLGHFVRASGFVNAANNQNFRVASSTATTIVGAALGLVAEAVPPAAAKLKVIGFQGASGDVTATSTGLGSTALNFTTLGLAVGQWIKIDSTTSAFGFATAANNGWARITAITATALTLDNLPAGWSVDAGAGKTITAYFGDQIKNGVTQSAMSIEEGFLGQTTPTYIVYRGMTVDSLQMTLTSKQRVTGQATLMGMGGTQSTSTLSGSPDAASTASPMGANSSVGRLADAGSTIGSPNWARSLDFTIKNNLRQIEDVTQLNPVAVREGACDVSLNVETYFGDNTLLAKFYAGTLSALNARVTKNSQAMVWQFPRITYKVGDPNAAARNQDVMLKLAASASYDSVTNAHVVLDRLEFFA